MTSLRNLLPLLAGVAVTLPAVINGAGHMASCMTTVDVACGLDDFSTLCAAAQIAGLADALTTGNWTVFAPNDEAFAALPAEVLEATLNSTELLTDILLFHAVPEVVGSEDLVCTGLVEMANGGASRTVCSEDSIFQKGAGNPRELMPRIIQTDIATCEGFIHVIGDIIILP